MNMIKNRLRKTLLEYHDIHRKKSALMNLMSSVQALADAIRYIESACEELEDKDSIDTLVQLKNKIMTDSGLGTGFDEEQDPDIISKIQKMVYSMDTDLRNLHKKNNLPTFF